MKNAYGSLINDKRNDKMNYKGKNYMSLATFQSIQKPIVAAHHTAQKQQISRSVSECNVDKSNPTHISEHNKELYGSLPFVAAFGMQDRERSVLNLLTSVRLRSFESLNSEPNKETPQLQNKNLITKPLLIGTIASIIFQFLIGYSIGIVNIPLPHYYPHVNTLEWSLAVASASLGGILGTYLGGLLANKKGRRTSLIINSWIFFIGGAIMLLSSNIYIFIFARFLTGIASGISRVVVPVYLGEISPPTLRGSLGTYSQFANVFGILCSNVSAFIDISFGLSLKLHFAVMPVFSLFLFIITPFLLESPRWLLSKQDQSIYARLVLKDLRGYETEEEIDIEVANFLYAAKKHKTNRDSAHSIQSMCDLFRLRDVKALAWTITLLFMARQFSGAYAVFYFSNLLFEGVLVQPLLGTCLVSAVSVIATSCTLYLIYSTARRTLMLLSAGGMFLSSLLVTSALLLIVPKLLLLPGLMLFMAFFEIGLGPIPWLMIAEVFDSKYVTTAMSWTYYMNYFFNFIIGLLFLYFKEALHSYVFTIFGGFLGMTFIIIYLFLPETRGRTVEEIQRLLAVDDNDMKQIIEVMSTDILDKFEDEEDEGEEGTYQKPTSCKIENTKYKLSPKAISGKF